MNLMFWKKKKVEEAIVREKDIAECETCRCLIRKSKAYRGASEIRIRRIKHFVGGYVCDASEEYIHHPYYCKVHVPKEISKTMEEP